MQRRQAIQEDCSRTMTDPQPYQSNTCRSTAFKTQISIIPNSETSLTLDSTKLVPRKPSMMDYATPTAKVSAFCRAVLKKLIPHEFWSTGEVEGQNEAVFHRNVDRFIGLRRFETLSLHELSQGIKVGLQPV